MAFIYLSAADLGKPDFLAVVHKKWERQCQVVYKHNPQSDFHNGKPHPLFGTCKDVHVPKNTDESVVSILEKDGWLVHEYEEDFVVISQLPEFEQYSEFKEYCVLMGYCTAEAIVVSQVKDIGQIESKIVISSGNLPLDMAAASFVLLVVKTKEKYLEQLMAEKPVPTEYCTTKRSL